MPSFTEKLMQAKVPQLLGTYLAVGFGLLQFVEFVSNRYEFSSIWVDRYLLIWLGLIPAVALLIYYGGLPTKDRATKAGLKTSLVFANLGFVGMLAILISNGAAAETETVAYVDDEGVEQERVIPSRAAVQKIGVFQFENASGETNSSDWLGVAYGELLHNSLRQRPEVISTNPFILSVNYEKYGAVRFGAINFATKRKVAEKVSLDYFIAVKHTSEEGNYALEGSMFQTSDGREVLKLSAEADNAFEAVDQLKAQIDEYLPAFEDENMQVTNLPSSALITDSEEALEAYMKGWISFQLRPDDLPTSIAYFQESVNKDANCASCAYSLGDKYYGLGLADSAQTYFRQAVRLAEVLPERDQFLYKFILLQVNQQHEATAKIMESYRTVFPYDFLPYSALEPWYTQSYGVDSAIALMTQAAEMSDREAALGRLYSLYTQKEDFEGAEQIMETSQEEYPDDDLYRIRRANLYQKLGRTDEARELLAEMMALDPLNVDPLYQLCKLEIRQGNYNKAEDLLKEMLQQSTTKGDSTNAYNSLTSVHAFQGRIDEASQNLDDYEAFISKSAPINRIKMGNFQLRLNLAMLVNDEVGVRNSYEELVPYDANYAKLYECIVPYLAIVYNYEELLDANNRIQNCSGTLESLGTMYIAYNEFSRMYYSGDYSATADLIDAKKAGGIDVAPSDVIIRINRMAGRYDTARELLEKELAVTPGEPDLLLEKAFLEKATGNTQLAEELSQRVLDIYSNADPDFVPAQRARDLLEDIESK
ncbi:MAG: tetratricopeptide repeat protein [Bacteroidota bacterium]